MSGHVRVAAAGMPANGAVGLPADPVWLPVRPERDDLARIADTIAAQEGDLVVVLPAWADGVVQRRLRTSASVLERPLAVHVTTLPPLAATLLVAVAAAIAPLARSGALLAAALPCVEAELGAFALLRGVLRLREPVPSLAQRARSALPGGWFVARRQPVPGVQSAARALAAGDLVADGHVLALAQRARGEWFGSQLPDAIQAGEPSAQASAWWGSPPALEAVTWPQDLAALAARALPGAVAPCPWCATLAATVPCPGCGHDRNPRLPRVAV